MCASIADSIPTSADDWRLVARTIRLVVAIPTYAAVGLLAGVGSLSVFVLSRNLDLLTNVVLSGNLGVTARVTVLVGLYPGFGAAYSPAQSVLLVATATLLGIDFALLAYHLREHDLSARDSSGSLTGVVLGTLGAGCASCGSALLAGLVSLFGAGGALTLLPLDGLEFTLVALVTLVLSIFWLAKGLRGGEVRGCPVDIGGS